MWQTVLGTVVSDACKLRDEARRGERDLHSEMNHANACVCVQSRGREKEGEWEWERKLKSLFKQVLFLEI